LIAKIEANLIELLREKNTRIVEAVYNKLVILDVREEKLM